MKASDCELCRLPHTEPVLYELWAAGRHDSAKRRAEDSQRVIDRLGAGVPGLTVEAAAKHFRYHRAPQPFGTGRFLKRSLEETRAWVSRKPRRREIMEFVARSRMVSTETVGRVFWPEASTERHNYPTLLACRTLRAMARRQLVYRQWIDGPAKGQPIEAYQLGRAGEVLLNSYSPVEFKGSRAPADISQLIISHDLGVGAIFAAFSATAGEHEILGKQIRAGLMPENFWVTKIGVSCHIPTSVDPLGRVSGNRRRDVRPDGFMVIGVEHVNPEPGKPASFGLPVLLERDTGSRPTSDVAAQVSRYFGIAVSRSMQARFPELEAAGETYAVPLLFVTGDYEFSAIKHIRTIKRASEKRFEELGYSKTLPVFFARFQDVMEFGLRAPTLPMFDPNEDLEQAPDVLTAMVRSSTRESRRAIVADQVLELDPMGAAEKRPGSETGYEKKLGETKTEREAAEEEHRARLERAQEFSEFYRREMGTEA